MTASIFAAAVALVTVYITQFLAERYRRHRDAASLAAGIAGELSAYEQGYIMLSSFLEHSRENARLGTKPLFRAIERPRDLYFPKVTEKIGLLGPELCESVVYVYSNLEGFRAALMLLYERAGEMDCREIEVRITLCLDGLERARNRAATLVPLLQAKAREPWRCCA